MMSCIHLQSFIHSCIHSFLHSLTVRLQTISIVSLFPTVTYLAASDVHHLIIILFTQSTKSSPYMFNFQTGPYIIVLLFLLHCHAGATLRLDVTEFEIMEGRTGQFTLQQVCVILSNDEGGLDRDIVINITTATDNATSKCNKLTGTHLSKKPVNNDHMQLVTS